jgi:pimeloyl-ACP methyl ester carboxylesterase
MRHMSFINIRGTDHYYQWITSDATDRPPFSTKPVLVFLHGWAGSTRYWESTARSLCPDFDCLLYDLRGFGRSRLSSNSLSDYDLSAYAEDLNLLLDGLKLSKVYLNGHSIGTFIAAQFLMKYSDRVEKAVFTASGIFEYQAIAFSIFRAISTIIVSCRPQWLSKITGCDRLAMQRFVYQPLSDATNQAFFEDYLQMDHLAAIGLIQSAVNQQATLDIPQAFAHLTVSTLLISGQYDPIIPLELGRKATALNSRIKQVILERTAHLPMLEAPTEYLNIIREFIL